MSGMRKRAGEDFSLAPIQTTTVFLVFIFAFIALWLRDHHLSMLYIILGNVLNGQRADYVQRMKENQDA